MQIQVANEPLKSGKLTLTLERAGFYSAAQGKDFPSHQHPGWEILYFTAGQIRCQINQELYDIQPGTLLIIPPNQPHCEFAMTPYANIYVQFTLSGEPRWPRICRDSKDHALLAICNQFAQEFGGQLYQSDELVHLLLQQLDILLMREQLRNETFSAEHIVNKVDGLLRTRFTTALTIKALAQEIGVSPSYLRAQYKRLRGVTLMHSLQTMRLDYAINIITSSNLSLEVIAQMTGFNSASHLSRYIKQYTGKTPGTIRHM